MPKASTKLQWNKETPGTHVFTGPKTDAEGKPAVMTSVYVSKSFFGSEQPKAGSTVTVTVEA